MRPFPIFAPLLLMLGCTSPSSSGALAGEDADLRPYALRCEMLSEPLGVDARRPRLSWKLESGTRGQRQMAYRLLVAEKVSELRPGGELLWDSGRVVSDCSLHVEYGGPKLRSRQRCVWRVRVWDAAGRPAAWSGVASWEMGLLDPADWTARWIEDGRAGPQTIEEHYADDPAPLFRSEFELDGVIERARLHVSGLGYHDARINGQRVGDAVLEPLWTHLGKRVFYSTHDVTGLVREGRNALGVTLGNGWFNPLPLRMWGRINLREHLVIGRPRLIAQLEVEFTDGRRVRVASDASWKTALGPVLRNNVFLGEVYDARRELPGWDEAGFDDSGWSAVALAGGELGPLRSRPLPPIRVTAHLQAVARTEPEPGVYVFDLGQNFAGWARLRVEGPEGTRVRMRFGELLHEDGTLNPLTSVCGHIDSWDGATGTTDNGTGCSTTLEAARILTTLGIKPRRTIRFMLWSAEEQGLLGSRAYVAAHPELLEKISAVFVHDMGTNPAVGLGCTRHQLEDFEKIFAPVKDLDPKIPFGLSVREGLGGSGGSDHASFLAKGVPAFFWSQKGRSVYGYGWHTQNDTYDIAIPDYQKHTATVVAIAARGVANLDHLLSREEMQRSRGARGARPSRRSLGVMLDAGTLKVDSVVTDSTAAKTGLKPGDVIVAIDGNPVQDRRDLGRFMNRRQPPKTLTVLRDGKKLDLKLGLRMR